MVSPGDLEDRASDALSSAIEQIMDAEDVEEPVTLDEVRQVLVRGDESRSAPLRRLEAADREALLSEVDGLIDVLGAETPAERFTHPFAGADLSRVIEHAIERVDEPTLGHVKGMVEDGLLAELIGEGEVAEEDEQSIRGELEALVARHGPDTFAEDFIGSS